MARRLFNSTSKALLLVSFALGAITPVTAQVGTTADTVRKWGLIGEWSTEDCKLPLAERVRATVIYRIDPDGSALYESGVILASIREAALTPEGHLSIRTFNPKTSETRTNVIGREADGIRSLMNRSDKNEYSIRDGRFTSTGEPSKVLKRCS